MHLIGGEQSNSSVVVDNEIIAKLVRRPEAGDHPDVELPDHLLRSGFSAVPGVAANAVVDVPGETVPADVVIVHDAIGHESDLWTKLLDDLELAIDLNVASDRSADVVGSSLADLLGRRTAELHHTLACQNGPAPMKPEAFTLLWQRSVLQTLRNAVKSTQRELQLRAATEGSPTMSLTMRIDSAPTSTRSWPGSTACARPSSMPNGSGSTAICTSARSSGPGPTWCSSTSRVSRPTCSMAQRTIKRSPLADVAGLVRSFDYAGRMALQRAIERGRVGDADLAAVQLRLCAG